MKTKNETKIEPKKWYNLQDVVKGRMLADMHSFHSVRRIVQADRQQRNLLHAVITGEGKGQKYRFLGENIQRFKKEWESGNYRLIPDHQ